MGIDLTSAEPLKDTDNPTAQEDLAVARLFQDQQCNVLAPHYCLHSYHLFIRFSPVREESRAYVHRRTVDEFRVTSFGARRKAELQRYQAYAPYYEGLKRYEGLVGQLRKMLTPAGDLPQPPGAAHRPVVRSFMISLQGLLSLQRPGEPLPTTDDTSFLAGVHATEKLFFPPTQGDPTAEWKAPFNGRDLHAHLLLAGDDLATLAKAVKKEIDEVRKHHGEVIGERFGYRKRIGPPGNQQDIEHFGYADGISNPLFLASDLRKKEFLSANKKMLKTQHFYPRSNLLFELPNCRGTYGSFQVFRQIEQDVAAFAKVADPDQKVGRRKDGTPLASLRGTDLNDFDYENDPPTTAKTGPRCPFHAHIRKANPRTTRDDRLRREHRAVMFVRRGMLYGQKNLDLETGVVVDDVGPVGLLFMGYMGAIERQFYHMQRFWFPIPGFPQSDPVLGDNNQDALVALPGVQNPPLTTVQGCSFFFVPPISWMENLPYSWP